MADPENRESVESESGGSGYARPSSVGPHDVKRDQIDPNNPGLDPADYNMKPGDNNNRNAADPGPGGPVNIKVKGQDEAEIVPETGRPRTGG